MKQFILISLFMLFVNTLKSQTKIDSTYICKIVDEMSDENFYTTSRNFVVSNGDKSKGISIDVFIDYNKDFGDVIYTTIFVKVVNIGNCCENDELIFLLADGRKIKVTSYNKFNCKGNAYFELSVDDWEMLNTTPIEKIRYTNGNSYESLTANVKPKDRRFFIQLMKSYSSGKFVELIKQ